MKTQFGRGFVRVGGGVVGWISGGEPVDGCDAVTLLIFASSKVEVKRRAREIGLWSPYAMDAFGAPDPEGVRAALEDPEGFVWNHGSAEGWCPSSELKRPVDD